MADTCTITGVITDAGGAPLANATLYATRDGAQTVVSGGQVSVNEIVTIATDNNGNAGQVVNGVFAAGFDLVQGYVYAVVNARQTRDWKRFYVNVPEASTADLDDTIVAEPIPPVTRAQQILDQAQTAATAAQRAQSVASISEKTSNYTLQDSDKGTLIASTGSSNVTVTIPTDATGGFTETVVISMQQVGTGVLSIAAASGVTLNGVAGASTQIQERWGAAQIIRLGANEWTVVGLIDGVTS